MTPINLSTTDHLAVAGTCDGMDLYVVPSTKLSIY